MYQSLESQQTPHTSASQASHGVSVVRILEKIDRVITAPGCTFGYTWLTWQIMNLIQSGTGPLEHDPIQHNIEYSSAITKPEHRSYSGSLHSQMKSHVLPSQASDWVSIMSIRDKIDCIIMALCYISCNPNFNPWICRLKGYCYLMTLTHYWSV